MDNLPSSQNAIFKCDIKQICDAGYIFEEIERFKDLPPILKTNAGIIKKNKISLQSFFNNLNSQKIDCVPLLQTYKWYVNLEHDTSQVDYYISALTRIKRSKELSSLEILNHKTNNATELEYLVNTYINSRSVDKLKELESNCNMNLLTSNTIERLYYQIDQKSKFGYYWIYVKTNYLTLILLLTSTVLWIIIIANLNLFEKIKYQYIAFFCTSYLITPLCLNAYDLIADLLNSISLDSNNTFIHYLGVVGFIEEFWKSFVPALFLTFYPKNKINTIQIFSLSALGFAVNENLGKIAYSGIQVFDERSIALIMLHITFSSIIGYAYSEMKLGNKSILKFILYCIIAALAHGAYDLFLVLGGDSPTFVLSLYIIISLVIVYSTIINNALNESDVFSYILGRVKLQELKRITLASLLSILLLFYIVLVHNYDPLFTFLTFFENLIFLLLITSFIAFYLTNFDLVKNNRLGIANFNFKRVSSFNDIIGVTVQLRTIIGWEKFKIHQRSIVKNDPYFYLVKNNSTELLIKSTIKNTGISNSKDVLEVRTYVQRQNGVTFTSINKLKFLKNEE